MSPAGPVASGTPTLSDAALAARIRSALAAVEVPGGETLAEYNGLSEIIVTRSAIALAISRGPGQFAVAETAIPAPGTRRRRLWDLGHHAHCPVVVVRSEHTH